MSFICGLDLGQAADYSALCVLEKDDTTNEPVYQCRNLHRFKLGTAYTSIVQQVGEWFSPKSPLAGAGLAVDKTGVGAPVVELMMRHATARWELYPITITAGHAVTQDEAGGRHVPKRDLVSALQVLLQGGRLKIAKSLPGAAILVKELEVFKAKITTAGNEITEAWRERDHDDLVLAVALSAWLGENIFTGPWDPGPPDPRGRLVSSPPWHDPSDPFFAEWSKHHPDFEDSPDFSPNGGY